MVMKEMTGKDREGLLKELDWDLTGVMVTICMSQLHFGLPPYQIALCSFVEGQSP